MFTFFYNHVRNSFSFWIREIFKFPILDLENKWVSCNILYSHSWGPFIIIGKWSHHNNWFVKGIHNLDFKPCILIVLLNINITGFQSTVWSLGNFQNLLFIQVFCCKVLPFTIVNLEWPFGSSIAAFLSSINFQNVVTISKSWAEVKFGGFSIFPNVTSFLLHDCSIEHG